MSEKTDLPHYTPRRLDDGAKFPSWEIDVAVISFMGMLVGTGSGFPVIGPSLGIGAAFPYGELKAGKYPGMAIHLLHRFTGFPEPKELPGSHIRELNGQELRAL